MITSILRTIIPGLWAAAIAKVLVLLPVLEPLRDDLLAYGDALAVLLSVVVLAAWYSFWRWLEPRLPDWLKRAVLGSAKSPVYQNDKTIPGELADTEANVIHVNIESPNEGIDWEPVLDRTRRQLRAEYDGYDSGPGEV